MKKFILSVTVLCLVLGFTACGNDTDRPMTEKDLETMTEKELEEALLALESAEESANTVEQGTAAAVGSFEAKQEIIDAAWDSGLVQIDDKLVQLPVHLSEWVDMGLDYEVDYGHKSKDYLFTQNELVRAELMYNGETLGNINLTKKTETPETLADMDPVIEVIALWGKPETVTMYFPGGLTFGDPYGSIEEKLGKATSVDENLTYMYGRSGDSKSDMYYGIRISVDKNTQTISRFEIGRSIQESNREDLTTLSFEEVPNGQTSDTHNVSLLWVSAYRQIPGTISRDRHVDSILDDNGKKYYISLEFSMLAQQYANPYSYLEYGDPILDTTDENGINRKIYNAGYAYIVVCSTDVHIFQATVSFNALSDPSEDALATLQDLVFDITNSVQF